MDSYDEISLNVMQEIEEDYSTEISESEMLPSDEETSSMELEDLEERSNEESREENLRLDDDEQAFRG